MNIRLSIKRKILLLFTCLYVSSVLYAQNKDKVFSYELLEENKYCWDGKNIKNRTLSDTNNLELSLSIHKNIILPFFFDFAKLMQDSILKISQLSEIKYCCEHYYIKSFENFQTESQRYFIDINILSDIKAHTIMENYLDSIKSQDYVYIDVISEAPIQGLVFWHFNELAVIYYNIFYDTREVLCATKSFLKLLNKQDD